MRILLLVLGLLAMTAGGLKFRDRIRTRIGTSPFSLAELGLGALACLLAASMPEPTPLHSTVAVLIIVAMIGAAVHQSRLTAAFQHRREVSESHRLKRFLEVANAASGADAKPDTTQAPSRPRSLAELAAQADKTAVRVAGERPKPTNAGTGADRPHRAPSGSKGRRPV